jgi:RHS repeat-associated protein
MAQASTWFDLVVGLDLHYEVVPPSPAPVPFPHPFVGVVFDPVGLVVDEMISSTVAWATETPRTTGPVLINGKIATATGDEAKMPTGHLLIPPGVSWFPPAPPPGDALLVFGSKTVEMRGGKAVRLGDPALSCSDPVRLPTSFVVSSGGPANVMVGGPTAVDWVAVAFAAGFRALRTKTLSKLAHAGIERFVPKNWKRARDFLHRAACFVTGHPVNVVNGSMFTTWSDFELPGPIPLSFSRRYRSSFCDRDSVLGYGWSHSLDQRLWMEPDTVVYLTDDGRELEFDTFALPKHVMREGDEIFDPISRLTLRSLGAFRWEVEAPGGLIHEFGPIRGETTENRDRGMARLTRIRNRGGDAITLRYDDRARLAEVVDSGGRSIKFEHDRDGRLEYIWLPAANGEGWRQHARFLYSPQGDLVETQDAMGKPIRFAYDHHNLVKETDRNGLSFYFVYDGWGPLARCKRTWGDGQIHDHEITYDIKGRRTIVEDSLGHATVYEWGEHGTVTKIVDARGGVTQFEYDGLTRKTSAIDPVGNTTRYTYDDRSNRTSVIDPGGGVTKVAYDKHDNPVSLTTPMGAVWRWAYDRWGRRVSETNPLGACTRYTYEHGHLVTLEDPAGARTHFQYDNAGNLVQMNHPDNTRRTWSYDARGQMIEATNPAGGIRYRQYDALGQVVRVWSPEGEVREFSYDAEGNVIRARHNTYDVQIGYQGLGRVAWKKSAGSHVLFQYDTEERLIAFINEQGFSYQFNRDAVGSVRKEVAYDGTTRRYDRDAAGRILKVSRPGGGRFSSFDYDTSGRPIKVEHYDGTTELFTYDLEGALLEATNETTTVRFERDAFGRVLKEGRDDHWISSHYDYRGLRAGLATSLGAHQSFARDTHGHVSSMFAKQDDQSWRAQMSRDALGCEIDRSVTGGSCSHWWRDVGGTPLQHQILHDDTLLRNRHYDWSSPKQLDEIQDSGHGTLRYQHDGRGYLTATTFPDGNVEYRCPDKAGNLFCTPELSDRFFGNTGNVLVEHIPEGKRLFHYDAEGNLVRRQEPDGREWHYHWSAAGRLSRVTKPDGEEVSFLYDALGRRVQKQTSGGVVTWQWSGVYPIHEIVIRGDQNSLNTWVFEPGHYTPFAKLSPSGAQNIFTDHVDKPLLVVGSDAQVLWQQRNDASSKPFSWGFSGQYFDEETNLYYNGHRYYDPTTQSYISRDPFGLMGGVRLYAYCRDPLREIDPFGLTSDDYLVTFFGRGSLRFIDKPDALLGAPNGLSWLTPLEDARKVVSAGDAARHAGMAPSVKDAFVNGDHVFGVSVPSSSVPTRLPVKPDADGNPNFLPGGHTAVRLPGDTYLMNPTREVVTPGGNPMPPGSVLFEVDDDGTWIPIRKF